MPEWLQRDKNLQLLNTLAVPSRAEAFVSLQHPLQLPAALDYAHGEGLPVVVLGQGSNVLLAERLEALVIMQNCLGIERLKQQDDSIWLRVAAGENWHGLVNWCMRQGYYGLENLALIPGAAGAAPVQNIGAYGVELASRLEQVHCIDLHTGEPVLLAVQDCRFAYRDSIFKRSQAGQLLIQSVDLKLSRLARVQVDYPALKNYLESAGVHEPGPQQVFEAVVQIRRSKLPDPAEIPNAGSFFKNPVLSAVQASALQSRWRLLPVYPQPDGSVRIAAAWLIEQCGFKQRQAQPVQVHARHALVITNPLRRGGSEVRAYAEQIIAEVRGRFGITLEQEPRSYGWV